MLNVNVIQSALESVGRIALTNGSSVADVVALRYESRSVRVIFADGYSRSAALLAREGWTVYAL